MFLDQPVADLTLDLPGNPVLFTNGKVSHFEVMRMAGKAFVRGEKHFPLSTQEKIVRQAGATTVFDDFAELLHGVRKGELVLVAGLRAFGTNHKDIAAAVGALHAKGAGAVDAATQRDSWKFGTQLLSEAITDLANERRGGGDAAGEIGKLGAEASAKARRAGWMPWGEIRKFWFDKRLTRAEVMAAVTTKPFKMISYNTIHRKLGARDAHTGRPPKQ